MFCMNCGNQLPDGAKFCGQCGTPQNVSSSSEAAFDVANVNQGTKLVPGTCTNCGASLQVDPNLQAAICPSCGTPYIVQQAINNFNINSLGNINIANAVINISGTNTENHDKDYSVVLTNLGNSKMGIIKTYVDYKKCGLLEAKQFVESLPGVIITTSSESEASNVASLFKSAGATVEIR